MGNIEIQFNPNKDLIDAVFGDAFVQIVAPIHDDPFYCCSTSGDAC